MQPQKANIPRPEAAAPPDFDGDDTVSDLSADALIGAAHTVAAAQRVTVTTPPEEGDETTSLAVTLEQPGRYSGPRRAGRTGSSP